MNNCFCDFLHRLKAAGNCLTTAAATCSRPLSRWGAVHFEQAYCHWHPCCFLLFPVLWRVCGIKCDTPEKKKNRKAHAYLFLAGLPVFKKPHTVANLGVKKGFSLRSRLGSGDAAGGDMMFSACCSGWREMRRNHHCPASHHWPTETDIQSGIGR